jgi:hypothetical protein
MLAYCIRLYERASSIRGCMCEGNWLSMLLNTNMNLRMDCEELAASLLQLADTSNIILLPQLVEALRYKSEGRGLDSQWCHWNFSLTQPLTEMSTWRMKAGGA